MTATQDDIRGWLMRGKREEATHLIVVCDTFEYTDYPVYVSPQEDVHACIKEIQGVDMQTIMEVYNLALPFHPQLQEKRAWNIG